MSQASQFLDNFTSSSNAQEYANAKLEEITGIQNSGLFGRKSARMYFTDLARPKYSFNATKMTSDVTKRIMPDVEVYVDPQTVKVSKKIIYNKKQTKGGWVLQFWGHDLTTITMNMQSGYYGYQKGQNILTMLGDIVSKTTSTGIDMGNRFIESLSKGTVDPLKVFQKIKNNVYNRRFDPASPFVGFPLITLVYENTPYTGFFNNFDYELSAQNPFNINFSFSFTVIPTNNKLLFEQNITNALTANGQLQNQGFLSLTDEQKASMTLFTAKTITNPSGTLQQLYQGGCDYADMWLEDTLNNITGNLGIESVFDDLFPSKEELT